MLKLLNTAYAFPPTALEAAKSLRDYAEAALTTAAFIEHTSITLKDDPVQVPIAHNPLLDLPEPSARPSPMRHFYAPRIKLRLSGTLRRRLSPGPLTSGSPASGPPGLCDMAHDIPTPPMLIAKTLAIPGDHRRAHSDSRTTIKRIVSTAPSAYASRCNNLSFVTVQGATHTRLERDQPLSTPVAARPHARTYRGATLHKQKSIRSHYGNHTWPRPPPH